jgi:hypothetical protein
VSSDHRVVHEAIWAPLIASAFVAARFFPFEKISFLVCPFKAITSIPCLTCGGTRAMIALSRFDLLRAVEMNPLVTIAALCGALYVLHAIRVLITQKPWRPAMPRMMRPGLIAAALLNWGYLIAVGR